MWRTQGLVLQQGSTKGSLWLWGASLGWGLTLMLGWVLSVLTNPCSVSNPSLILKRRFCSAEMCVMRRFSIWGTDSRVSLGGSAGGPEGSKQILGWEMVPPCCLDGPGLGWVEGERCGSSESPGPAGS